MNRMKHRRKLLAMLASMGAMPALPVGAQELPVFPQKPVKLVVPYPAGGATDVIARVLSERMAAVWGQTVVVDNKPGAGTTLAAAQVAKAKPDGHTLYMTTSAHTISASLYKKLDFDPVADFTPLCLLAKVPLVLVVRPDLNVKTWADFTQALKTKPDPWTFASPGNGTAQHLAAEWFKTLTGAKMTHVPYRGDAPAVADLMGGQVDAMLATLTAVLPQIASGKLRPIALAHGVRIERVPHIPTFDELGLKGFEAATWFGVLAPAGLPPMLKQKMADDLAQVGASAPMRQRLLDLGAEVLNSRPSEFEAFMRAESKKWSDIVRASGATLD
jgi:tripartite-type tricarboxylate transporter receptor subunit TctC